jgi:hypothetical protein
VSSGRCGREVMFSMAARRHGTMSS